MNVPATDWFELFETVRKVLIVGVPSTFTGRGGIEQLFWGLLVCFSTFGAYMVRLAGMRPYLCPLPCGLPR